MIKGTHATLIEKKGNYFELVKINWNWEIDLTRIFWLKWLKQIVAQRCQQSIQWFQP